MMLSLPGSMGFRGHEGIDNPQLPLTLAIHKGISDSFFKTILNEKCVPCFLSPKNNVSAFEANEISFPSKIRIFSFPEADNATENPNKINMADNNFKQISG